MKLPEIKPSKKLMELVREYNEPKKAFDADSFTWPDGIDSEETLEAAIDA